MESWWIGKTREELNAIAAEKAKDMSTSREGRTVQPFTLAEWSTVGKGKKK